MCRGSLGLEEVEDIPERGPSRKSTGVTDLKEACLGAHTFNPSTQGLKQICAIEASLVHIASPRLDRPT